MKRPGKAFVLAAGFGTRLLPLTRELPKPLFPIWNVPAIERVLAMLKRWGVRDVLVNVHHRADRMFDHLRTRVGDGLRVAISFEPEILGTGGALRKADWFIIGDEPVWVLNADVVAELDARPLLKAYRPDRTIAVAWVHGSRGPRTVEVQRGVITNFQSRRPGQPGTFTFCGVQLIHPALVERAAGFLPREPVMGSIIDAYRKAQAAGWTVAGVESPNAYWADIGNPAQYLACHRELHGGREYAAVDATARVHAGAEIANSVIWAGAVLCPRARVRNAIVARDTVVHGRVNYLALPAVQALNSAEAGLLAAHGWPPSACTALPFGPRGSARSFTRIEFGRRTALLVQYDPGRAENRWYVIHARFLRRLGVPAPRVLADDPEGCVSLFEDLGDASVQEGFAALSEARRERLYTQVLDSLLRFHERGAAVARRSRLPLMPGFRPALYRWERNYFAEHMLENRCGLSKRDTADIQRELAAVGCVLNRLPRVLLHRDLQSSNILVRGGQPYFIDFQGMRMGPAVYDLASLLCDPYVDLNPDLRRRLLEHYAERSAAPEAMRRYFWHGAVQRLVQALGAYARLGSQSATRAFARYIPAALDRLAEALVEGPRCPRLAVWCDGERAAARLTLVSPRAIVND